MAFDAQRMISKTFENCKQIREGVGPNGDWAIDYHTRLDQAEAVRLSGLLEGLHPLFVEDLVRSENAAVYRVLRQQVKRCRLQWANSLATAGTSMSWWNST